VTLGLLLMLVILPIMALDFRKCKYKLRIDIKSTKCRCTFMQYTEYGNFPSTVVFTPSNETWSFPNYF